MVVLMLHKMPTLVISNVNVNLIVSEALNNKGYAVPLAVVQKT